MIKLVMLKSGMVCNIYMIFWQMILTIKIHSYFMEIQKLMIL